jgi:hypothetical protein
MKYFLFSTACLFLLHTTANAQSEKIEEIRKIYYDVGAKISAQEKGDSHKEVYRFSVNMMLPGIGPQEKELDFYYNTEQDYEGQQTHKLVKVRNSYNVGLLYRMYEEYLFKNDTLIFYYEKVSGDECGEIRMYFSGDKLIKLKTTQVEGCDTASQMYPEEQNESGNNYIERIAYVQKQAKHLVKAFNNMQAFNN